MNDLIGSWKSMSSPTLTFENSQYQLRPGDIIAVTQVSECGTRVMIAHGPREAAWHDSVILIYFKKVE